MTKLNFKFDMLKWSEESGIWHCEYTRRSGRPSQ